MTLLLNFDAHFIKIFLSINIAKFYFMSEEKKISKSCSGKSKAMFAYGIIQLGSSFVSALALVVISLGICSLKNESKFFNQCVEEIVSTGAGKADAVRFCNGG